MTGSDARDGYSPRVRRKRRQARKEIMAAAETILEQDGLEGVTLASVAERLALTKQAIYHYYPSKEALLNGLVARLLDEEIEVLTAAIESAPDRDGLPGVLIRAFHAHYSVRLNAFRAVYCQTQLFSGSQVKLDEQTLREEINPRTRQLFDLMEQRLSEPDDGEARRGQWRRLAFSAWLSALGLMTMKGIAEATSDPLVHHDEDLLDTLSAVFDAQWAKESSDA